MALTYAVLSDFRAWMGDPTIAESLVTRPLKMAHKDIDTACGPGPVFADTGLRFATDEVLTTPVLTVARARILQEATCAQAEYRMVMGEDFMIKDQYANEQGPDYGSSGQLRKVPGMVYSMLQLGGFLNLHGDVLRRDRLWSDDRYRRGLPNDV